MKNKEIEELLNNIKFEYDNKEKWVIDMALSANAWGLLLSYIEQLEKRNKELYEGFMATQEELTDYATKNEQLENNRDKAIELLEESAKYREPVLIEKQILNLLKGDSDD